MFKRARIALLLVLVILLSSFSSVYAEEYVVKEGDALWKIAQKYGVTVDEIMAMNDIFSQDLIYVNQVIKLSADQPTGNPEGKPESDDGHSSKGAPSYSANMAEIREQVYIRAEHVAALDLDNDGFLSEEEYNGTDKLFIDLDVDADGKLSAEETKYMQTFQTIPSGAFTMGTNTPVTAFGRPEFSSTPAHEVEVDGFQMGTTELTTAQYVMYLNSALKAGEIVVELGDLGLDKRRLIYHVPTYVVYGALGTTYEGKDFTHISQISTISHEYGEGPLLLPEHPLNQSWIYYHEPTESFHVHPGFENWPAAFVRFYGSMAYAEYYDLSLPTEAEWEYAASGGKQYTFPTVDGTNDGQKSNYRCYNVLEDPNFTGADEPENFVGFRLDVGKYPANPYGLYDMAGNVWEWTIDTYNPEFYQYCIDNNIVKNPLSVVGEDYVDPPADMKGVTGGPGQQFSHGARVTRGGSYNYHEACTYTSLRFPTYTTIANDHFGARYVIRSEETVFNGK